MVGMEPSALGGTGLSRSSRATSLFILSCVKPMLNPLCRRASITRRTN